MQPKRQENRITGNWSGWVEPVEIDILFWNISSYATVPLDHILCWHNFVEVTKSQLHSWNRVPKKYNLTPDFLRGSQRAGRLALQSRWAYIEVTPELISWISVYALWRKCPRKIKQILMGNPEAENTLLWSGTMTRISVFTVWDSRGPSLASTIQFLYLCISKWTDWSVMFPEISWKLTPELMSTSRVSSSPSPAGAKDGQR
jgi:hypothetical protein